MYNDCRPSSSSGILQHPLSSIPHSPRRIRFAPLPDPRRSVLVTEDGQELPITNDNHLSSTLQDTSAADLLPQIQTTISSSSSSSSSTTPSATSTPNTVTPASSVRSSPVSQNTALPSSKQSDDNSTLNSNPPSAWPRSLFLLRPFKRTSTTSSGSSSHSLTPTPSIEQPTRTSSKRPLSTEEILTLGTINLFRTASRESRNGKEKENDAGWGLSRWSSASGTTTSIDRGSLLAGSSPLARTQSAGSYSSKSKKAKKGIGSSLFSTSSTSSLSSDTLASSSDIKRLNPRPTTTPAMASKYKGTRMLNGRVYGAPKNHHLKANPFATARDEEPEFVEWGYGGMGSVKGAKSAGVAGNGVNWSRLSGGSVLKDPNSDESRPSSGAADRDDDDEDGSGMGWVRRRREERERKKREEEAAAKNALAVPETRSQDTTPTPTRSSTLDAAAFEDTVMAPPTEDADATPLAAPHTSPLVPSKPEHITEAITIPVHKPHHHHHHHRNHSHGHGRTKSKEALEITLVDGPVGDVAPTTAMPSESAMVTPTPANLHPTATPLINRPRSDSSASTDTSASETDSDSESEDANTPGDDDDDEEDEREMERRKTALGAGVEKISRHGAAAAHA
ncbi:hypothetical protein BJ165DRAFT_1504279 [Panaeolus papilionaceus]|nr:hypothetical protein BJ165DRAFT_1504279 [Panaeolus papilionaceus]